MLNPEQKQKEIHKEYQRRLILLNNMHGASETELELIRAHYSRNFADFISDFGETFDPRNSEVGLKSWVPFQLFPRQKEYIKFVTGCWLARKDGICVKSRDMGVSWLSAAIAACFIIFYEGFVCGFGSRKEEYVDQGSPKSLFWKIREFIARLPDLFKPQITTKHMEIRNADNGSYIVGEAGDNIGRGDRASIYFVDEAAFVERQNLVDAALSQTSNCKIWVSTINEPGDAFHQKIIGGAFDVFEFDWRDDPRKDERWYQAQKKKYAHDPILLAREIDRDYSASTGDSWIPVSMIEPAQRLGPADIRQDPYSQKMIVGVDAAHEGDDDSVISPRAGRIAYPQICGKQWNGPRLASEVIEYCNHSPAIVYAIVIELDGPGVSCYDTLRQHDRYRDIVFGIHTGAFGSGGRYSYNLRALMYRRVKEWLDRPPVSVPSDIHFRVQLSSVKYGYRDGKLLLRSKKEMKKDGFKSPDKADAFALTFAIDEELLELPQEYEEEPEHNTGRSHYTGY